MKKSMIRNLVCALFIVAGTTATAHGGFHGGGLHGGGWHGGGWHGGGWHGGGWHGGGWHGGGWSGVGWGGVYGPAYYGGCEAVRVCNQYGNCWLRNSCY